MSYKIPGGLTDLIDRAEAEGAWLFSPYQQIWFSPAELRAHNAEGRFRWGPINWMLRHPKERVEQIDNEITVLQKELNLFIDRLKDAGL